MLVLPSWERILDVQADRRPGIPLLEEPVDALEAVLDEREMLAAVLHRLFEVEVGFQAPAVRETVGQFAGVTEQALSGKGAGGGQWRVKKGVEPIGHLRFAFVEGVGGVHLQVPGFGRRRSQRESQEAEQAGY